MLAPKAWLNLLAYNGSDLIAWREATESGMYEEQQGNLKDSTKLCVRTQHNI